MQQTTLQLTSQKKRASRAFVVLALTCTGCLSGQVKVFIDLDSIPVEKVSQTETSFSSLHGENLRATVELPELEQRDLFIGSAEEKAREALELYRITQERAVEAVISRLEATYTAEVARDQKEEEKIVEQEYQSWVTAELSELRDEFENHAKVMGPLRDELAAIVGFPDPDPRSIRVPPAHDKVATEHFQKALALRNQIADHEAEYKKAVQERLGALEVKRTSLLSQLAQVADLNRRQALERAQKEARAVAQQALGVLERSALAPEAQLPQVLGAQSSVESPAVRSEPMATGALADESRESLREQLDVFLKVMNYRLVDSPRKGRDATREFLEWRQKYRNKR